MTPAITIGIMTHNYGRYLCEAVDSVLAQSRTDWELIISDDASTDGTNEIVAPYLADPRITYVRHAENLGQSRNWGFLLGQGTAPVLAVLHADDSWLPDVTLNVIVDYEYFLRLCAYARKVQSSAQALTLYRLHGHSATAESIAKGTLAQERSRLISLCSVWAIDPKLRPGLRRLHFNLAKADFSEGVSNIMYGNLAGGRRLMRRGLTSSPVLLTYPKVLIDCLLCLSGRAGLRLFRNLHCARLED